MVKIKTESRFPIWRTFVSINWDMSTKFGLLIDFDLLKAAISTNAKPEIVLLRFWRHIALSRWRPRPLNTIIQRGHSFNFNVLLDERRDGTDWVLRVKAALVIDDGKFRPFVISRHNFLLMTSTRPPFDTTRRNSSYRSSVCLAMIGIRFTGVPAQTHHLHHSFSHRVHHVSFLLNFLIVSCCHLNYLHMIWNSG